MKFSSILAFSVLSTSVFAASIGNVKRFNKNTDIYPAPIEADTAADVEKDKRYNMLSTYYPAPVEGDSENIPNAHK